jgi:hypothetical protein
MRALTISLFAGVVLIAIAALSPAHARCEVSCWRHCERVPGGVYCGRRCREHCWHEPQRYYPPPQHHFDYVPSYQPGPHIDPALITGALALLLIAVAAGILSSLSSSGHSDIAAIEHSTQEMRTEAAQYDYAIDAINADIAEQERAAFEEGRAQADLEWELDRRRS